MKDLLQLIGGALLIAGAIYSIWYPITRELDFQNDYHDAKGISRWFAGFQFAGIFACYATYSDSGEGDGFYLALGITVIIFVLAVLNVKKRLTAMGCDRKRIRTMQVAQVLAPIGFIVLVLILAIVLGRFEKKDEKK